MAGNAEKKGSTIGGDRRRLKLNKSIKTGLGNCMAGTE